LELSPAESVLNSSSINTVACESFCDLQGEAASEKRQSPREESVKRKKIPPATIVRLPLYLRCLTGLDLREIQTLSSYELAKYAGTNAAKLRKDLSYLGKLGVRGVGYNVRELYKQITKQLGLEQEKKVIVVGVGQLGSSLLGYKSFSAKSFKIIAAFDENPKKVGQEVDGFRIQHIDELEKVSTEAGGIDIGIITVPPAAAQSVVDKMVAVGIGAILNFAPVHL
jgi:redox-sensing transcriptional repressor